MSLPHSFFMGKGGPVGLYPFSSMTIAYTYDEQVWNDYTVQRTGVNGDESLLTITGDDPRDYVDGSIHGMYLYSDRYFWLVPSDGSYQFILRGSQGGNSYGIGRGGSGAEMTATYDLTEGEILSFTLGLCHSGTFGSGLANGKGGGGASIIAKHTSMGDYTTGFLPLMIAGGGGGAVGSDYEDNVFLRVGGDASYDINGYWNSVPPAGSNYPVNTKPGGGGLFGNSSNQYTQLLGAKPARQSEATSSLDVTSSYYNSALTYNGVAGGAGLLENGGNGHNSSEGGFRLNSNPNGGTSESDWDFGGFGGGGGGRNTSGGGGGGYIGGSGGYWSSGDQGMDTAINGSWQGGVGGTSIVLNGGYDASGTVVTSTDTTTAKFGKVTVNKL